MPIKILLTMYQELSDCQILPLKRQEFVQSPVLVVWFSQNKVLPRNVGGRTDSAPHDKASTQTMKQRQNLSRVLCSFP